MIYNGNYYNDTLYGTSNNQKVLVETTDNAIYLSCELEVIFNGEVWAHVFEIPFFNNMAEFYFENFIHSIITQKFTVDQMDKDNYKFLHFEFASIRMVLKEMIENDILDQQELSFSMTLGSYDAISLSEIEQGNQYLLPISNTSLLTKKGIVSFSFVSQNLPEILIVSDGVNESQIGLTPSETSWKLHCLTIPIKNILSEGSDELTLSLKFGQTIIALGKFIIIGAAIDHTMVTYQNEFGTLSIIEFIGELKQEQNYKFGEFKHRKNNRSILSTTSIEKNKLYMVNTGYILDSLKYEMLSDLLKSFNTYLWDTDLKKMIVARSQRLKPYRSNYYLNNETIKFKLSENDDILHRIF